MSANASLSLTVSSDASGPTHLQTLPVARAEEKLQALHEANSDESGKTLESHEVIELQAFSERKTWIEEKIKFLQSLPPVEVFAGLDELTTSSEVSELANRAQLEEWLNEHDKIEKETEIFDSGDLKKLKKITKAATQRNLSSDDTDLIELTLTTLYTLDKLLHLLRDRSENLDLLALRLTWEEHRVAAWSDRRMLLENLRVFLDSRARWSPSMYRELTTPEVDPPVTQHFALSTASEHSIGSSPGFSRSIRYKLAELLGRDAAQFASRVATLRHSRVAASGRALDRLIDNSRKPVPDAILDEQDRLEDKCGKELENLGKFVMGVIMQWKKADEIYVETKKDQNTAQALIDEMELAKLRHPISGQDASFTSRVESLVRHLSARANPASLPSVFPRPVHSLFPDQAASNDTIADVLSSELTNARELSERATSLMKEYHTTWEAVRQADDLRRDLTTAQSQLVELTDYLQYGFSADDGDGTPPDLTQPTCLEPLRFSAYLARLPPVTEALAQGKQVADRVLQSARVALLSLNRRGVDHLYKRSFLEEMEQLEAQSRKALQLNEEIQDRVARLRELRRIWFIMAESTDSLEVIGESIKDAMTKQRWRQQLGGDGLPMTPESPMPSLPPVDSTPPALDRQLDVLQARLSQDITSPLLLISSSLTSPLANHFASHSEALSMLLATVRDMYVLWLNIQRQTQVMESAQDEVHALEVRIDESRVLFDQAQQDILSGGCPDESVIVKEHELLEIMTAIRTEVQTFTDGLPTRIPFISRQDARVSHGSIHARKLSTLDRIQRSGKQSTVFLSFDPASVDRAVRSDSNVYAMRLAGAVKSLEQKHDLFGFGKLARHVDCSLSLISSQMRDLNLQIDGKKKLVQDVTEMRSAWQDCSNFSESLASVKGDIEDFSRMQQSKFIHSLSIAREAVAQMRAWTGGEEDVEVLDLLKTRLSAFEDAELQVDRVLANIDSLKAEILAAERTEEVKVEQDRLVPQEQRTNAAVKQGRQTVDVDAGLQEEVDRFNDSLNVDNKIARLASEDIKKSAVSGSAESAQYVEDVFGLPVGPYPSVAVMLKDATDLLARVRSLRKRLQFIGINNAVRPATTSQHFASTSPLPTEEQTAKMASDFAQVLTEVKSLPSSVDDPALSSELRFLRDEVATSVTHLLSLERLAKMTSSVLLCDVSLSDLLDHIDSFPAAPAILASSLHITDPVLTPEEQMTARLDFTERVVDEMIATFAGVTEDDRAVVEQHRILQTWKELKEMAADRINGVSSRPPSAHSSGRNSVTSITSRSAGKKLERYAKLSMGARGRGGYLVPTSSRRVVVSSGGRQSRSSSVVASNRSVSGPLSSSSSLHGSTFSSRQRTTSVSSITLSHMTPTRIRSEIRQAQRRSSPTFSETSSHSNAGASTRLSTSHGTWSRAPRQSFPIFPRGTMAQDKIDRTKQKYVANPTNRLDIAVGDVVNNLPVNIHIQVVADTWQDQSGKYWIGDSDPKLCFCRILRSRTVMVRVGGGWTELSKFIKGHFADLFRLLPESPPRTLSRQEKWISSSTFLQPSDAPNSPPEPPRTPEPQIPFIPSFALSTPDGTKAHSIKSASSPSSPLTPFQFIRRADVETPGLPLNTPSKGSSIRPKASAQSTPSRGSIWRP